MTHCARPLLPASPARNVVDREPRRPLIRRRPPRVVPGFMAWSACVDNRRLSLDQPLVNPILLRECPSLRLATLSETCHEHKMDQLRAGGRDFDLASRLQEDRRSYRAAARIIVDSVPGAL